MLSYHQIPQRRTSVSFVCVSKGQCHNSNNETLRRWILLYQFGSFCISCPCCRNKWCLNKMLSNTHIKFWLSNNYSSVSSSSSSSVSTSSCESSNSFNKGQPSFPDVDNPEILLSRNSPTFPISFFTLNVVSCVFCIQNPTEQRIGQMKQRRFLFLGIASFGRPAPILRTHYPFAISRKFN